MARPPASLNDFIGQRRVVAHLGKLVARARERGEAIGSLLLLGPPGMGKTALAAAIAREYSGTHSSAPSSNFLRILAGPRITAMLVGKLTDIKYGDVLFIDEIHSLDREAQELLNVALDDRRTLGRTEDGKLDRGTSVSLADFTLVGATTEPGKVTHALRSRLNQVALDPYELRELKAIAEKAGRERGLTLTAQAARHLAERSHRTPRSVEGLVELLRRTKGALATVDQQTVRVFLEELGIDERGLNRSQQEYLRTLAAAVGRYTSISVLGTRLGLDAKYIREDIESHLMLLNLVEIGSGGRALTEKGRALAGTMACASEAADDSDLSDSEPKEVAS